MDNIKRREQEPEEFSCKELHQVLTRKSVYKNLQEKIDNEVTDRWEFIRKVGIAFLLLPKKQFYQHFPVFIKFLCDFLLPLGPEPGREEMKNKEPEKDFFNDLDEYAETVIRWGNKKPYAGASIEKTHQLLYPLWKFGYTSDYLRNEIKEMAEDRNNGGKLKKFNQFKKRHNSKCKLAFLVIFYFLTPLL